MNNELEWKEDGVGIFRASGTSEIIYHVYQHVNGWRCRIEGSPFISLSVNNKNGLKLVKNHAQIMHNAILKACEEARKEGKRIALENYTGLVQEEIEEIMNP